MSVLIPYLASVSRTSGPQTSYESLTPPLGIVPEVLIDNLSYALPLEFEFMLSEQYENPLNGSRVISEASKSLSKITFGVGRIGFRD